MKKQALSLALAALLLAGCGAKPQSTAPQTTETPAPADAETDATPTAATGEPLHLLQHGDEKNFYWVQPVDDTYGLLTATDYTGTGTPLCSVPGCTHTDESCPAVVPGGLYAGSVYVLNESELLIFHEGSDDASANRLVLADRDGNEIRELRSGADACQADTISTLTDGEHLYYMIDSGIYCLDTATGDVQNLPDTADLNWMDGTAWGRQILAAQYTLSENATGQEGTTPTDLHLLLVDADTGARTALRTYPGYDYETNQGREHNTAYKLLDGKLYELDYATMALTETDLATGETRTVVEQMPPDPYDGKGAFSVAFLMSMDGYLVAEYDSTDWTSDEAYRGQIYTIYLIDLQTGAVREKPTLPTIDRNGYALQPQLVQQLAGRLLLVERVVPYSKTLLGPDGSPYTASSEYEYFGVLSNADYLAGTPNYTELGLYR